MDTIPIAFDKITPYLTDFRGGHNVFRDAFETNARLGCPIRTVLELGIYRISGEPKSLLPGQSTKTLMILGNHFSVEKHVSLDIDDCRETIETCKDFLQKHCDISPLNHSFVQSSSIDFDVRANFPNGIDFCFIDTSHDDSYVANTLKIPGHDGAGMTYKEFCHYAPHLTENGRLFMHDTHSFYLPKQYGYNTEGALEKFLDDFPQFLYVEHNPNVHGLGELIRLHSKVAKEYAARGVRFGIKPYKE